MIRKDWRSSFGGKLGQEINKIADAIRMAQIVPSPNLKVSYTPNGTVLQPDAIPSATTATQTNSTRELAKIVAPTATELADVKWYDSEDNPTTNTQSLHGGTWDNKYNIILCTKPCDINGNDITGRESERNWIVQARWLLSDIDNSTYLTSYLQNSNSSVANYHIPNRFILYWSAYITGYLWTNSYWNSQAYYQNNPFNEALLELNKSYDMDDIIVIDKWAENGVMEVPVYQLYPYDGANPTPNTNKYPYIETNLYDTNQIGRYYVNHSLPDIP